MNALKFEVFAAAGIPAAEFIGGGTE